MSHPYRQKAQQVHPLQTAPYPIEMEPHDDQDVVTPINPPEQPGDGYGSYDEDNLESAASNGAVYAVPGAHGSGMGSEHMVQNGNAFYADPVIGVNGSAQVVDSTQYPYAAQQAAPDSGSNSGSDNSFVLGESNHFHTAQQNLPYDPQPYPDGQFAQTSASGLQNMPAASTPQFNARSPLHGALAYPRYDNLTPPPVFPSKEHAQIISPPSNPLSATSSVTNLNLNSQFSHLGLGPAGDMNSAFSKSENNLNAPPTFHKFGHNRSVSSTSSFYHDRTDSASLVDFSQNLIQQYLGDNSNTLLPRMKTIELYRKNAKRSNDPGVLFEYAQYMLQTALLLDTDASSNNSTPKGTSQINSPAKKKDISTSAHKRNKSFDDRGIPGSGANGEPINDKLLKRALLKEATVYLKKLSDKGYVDAQYLLADAYSSGALFKVDNREAFVLFQSAAKHGHIESAYRTAYCFEEGLGTGRDARKAIDYLKIAAAKNHAAAMYKLGLYSFYGRMGLPRDVNTKKAGIKWLERSSNLASELIAGAPYELGKIYYHGFQDIVIPDKKYALELYSQAAALGHIRAAALLGQFYEVGEILPQDSNLSIHYYTQAALGGDPESMLAMCAWYLVGSDPFLPKDESEAFEWAKRAALCNLPKAQFALANFYDKGIGCLKNTKEAQLWYKKAAENGDEKSKSRVTDKEFVTKLTKQQLKNKKSDLALNASTSYSPLSAGYEGPVSSALDSKAQDKDCIIM